MNTGTEPTGTATAQDLAVFGERGRAALLYAHLLRTEGIARGLLGPREHEQVWSRHVMNSVAISELVPADAHVVDLGSGAGLPGIPLALARPDLHVTLVDVKARRVAFLLECRAALAERISPTRPLFGIVRSRVETLRPHSLHVAVTRAFAPLPRLLPLMQQLLSRDGMFVVLKGSGTATDIAEVDPAHFQLRAVRCEIAESHHTVALVGRAAAASCGATSST